MKIARNLAFIVLCVTFMATSGQARTATSCNAWSCTDCENCQLLEEEDCDSLCRVFNGPESPFYTEECDSWIYSQVSPSCGEMCWTCGYTCECSPDEV